MDITPNVEDVNIAVSLPAIVDIAVSSPSIVDVSSIGGVKGDTGSQGIQGVQGIIGLTGSIGLTGAIGTTGLTGTTGATGLTGSTGASNTLSIGTVTNGTAAATITGTAPTQTLNLVLPTGSTGTAGTNGINGSAATIAVGTTTTGIAGSSATVTNSGTTSAATFNFTVPQGAAGTNGTSGTNGTNGSGVIVGGTASQSLTKIDATNYNTQWSTIDKTFVGLANVDNTSDINKPVSTAQAAADATKAAIAGQVFTGAISATNLSGTNTGDNATNTQYSGIVTNATHTGDAAGATVLTLATVNANIGSFGTATSVPAYTVNAKGLITASANTAIQIPESQVTSLVTDLAGKQPTLTLTTIGTSGASTLVGATLNIPSYAGGGSGITRNISTITTAVTVGATASVDYEVNVGAGGTPTLPTAVGNTNEYSIKNIDTANHVINTTLSQTIDGSASGITIVPNQSLTLLSDTANWRII